jgi:hypothetical protein
MIKTKLTRANQRELSSDLPALYRYKETGFIVLFTSKYVGTVIDKGSGDQWKLGEAKHDWISCTDPIWEPLQPGDSVTLTVE